MNSETLEQVFQKAVRTVQSGGTTLNVSDDIRLQYYGLYKQATMGDCSAPKPIFFDWTGTVKWNAWNSLKGMSQSAAMSKYIELLDVDLPGWR